MPISASLHKVTRILGGIVIVAGALFLLSSTLSIFGQWQTRHWPSVQGRIVEGGYFSPPGQDEARPVVTFAIGGRRYRQGVDYRPGEVQLQAVTIEEMRRFTYGAKLRVYYDPAETPHKIDHGLYQRDAVALARGLAPGIFGSLIGDLVMIVIGLLVAWLPSHLWGRAEKGYAAAAADPANEVVTARVDTPFGRRRYSEVRARKDAQHAPYVEEDAHGVVLFDSTNRPLRLVMGGGFGMLLWAVIATVLYFAEAHWGTFEYLFLGGWAAFALLIAGVVYEVRINRRKRSIGQCFGWFFLTAQRRYDLRDFDRVLVQGRFPQSGFGNGLGDRNIVNQNPTFAVTLGGVRLLNLRVFPDLSDARRMAEEVAAYLDLPLASDDQAV